MIAKWMMTGLRFEIMKGNETLVPQHNSYRNYRFSHISTLPQKFPEKRSIKHLIFLIISVWGFHLKMLYHAILKRQYIAECFKKKACYWHNCITCIIHNAIPTTIIYVIKCTCIKTIIQGLVLQISFININRIER